MNEHVRFYPNIDYRAHPAFRDFGVPVRNDDSIVDAMIEDIDRELDAQVEVAALLLYVNVDHRERAYDGGRAIRMPPRRRATRITTPSGWRRWSPSGW